MGSPPAHFQAEILHRSGGHHARLCLLCTCFGMPKAKLWGNRAGEQTPGVKKMRRLPPASPHKSGAKDLAPKICAAMFYGAQLQPQGKILPRETTMPQCEGPCAHGTHSASLQQPPWAHAGSSAPTSHHPGAVKWPNPTPAALVLSWPKPNPASLAAAARDGARSQRCKCSCFYEFAAFTSSILTCITAIMLNYCFYH